jgi:hypothetical protein
MGSNQKSNDVTHPRTVGAASCRDLAGRCATYRGKMPLLRIVTVEPRTNSFRLQLVETYSPTEHCVAVVEFNLLLLF